MAAPSPHRILGAWWVLLIYMSIVTLVFQYSPVLASVVLIAGLWDIALNANRP